MRVGITSVAAAVLAVALFVPSFALPGAPDPMRIDKEGIPNLGKDFAEKIKSGLDKMKGIEGAPGLPNLEKLKKLKGLGNIGGNIKAATPPKPKIPLSYTLETFDETYGAERHGTEPDVRATPECLTRAHPCVDSWRRCRASTSTLQATLISTLSKYPCRHLRRSSLWCVHGMPWL
jgi:hypothetical protein